METATPPDALPGSVPQPLAAYGNGSPTSGFCHTSARQAGVAEADRAPTCAELSTVLTGSAPFRVLYEVSVLGAAARHSTSRTGIFRVVENLLRALWICSDHCELRVCVLDNLEQLKLTKAWLASQSELAQVRVEPETRDSVVDTWSAALRERISNRGRKIMADRLALEGLRLVRRLTNANRRLGDQVAWRWPQILHLPFYVDVPETAAGNGLIQFQMIHDLIPILFPQYFNQDTTRRFLEKKLDRPSSREWFFANSESTKHDICNLAKGLDPDRVIVTPLAASEYFRPCADAERIEAVRNRYGIPPVPFFLSVCTLEPRKNLAHVIRSFARLIEQERIADLNLVLVGTKGWQYDKIFAEAASSAALKRRVIFTGYVPDEDLSPLYTDALAFLYLSLYEGFGLPALEAMQCGTPVIASNNSSLPEVVADAGLLLDAQDQDALCAALHALYSDAGRRTTLREKGLRQAAQFSWRRCARETLLGYHRALQST